MSPSWTRERVAGRCLTPPPPPPAPVYCSVRAPPQGTFAPSERGRQLRSSHLSAVELHGRAHALVVRAKESHSLSVRQASSGLLESTQPNGCLSRRPIIGLAKTNQELRVRLGE